MPKKANKVKLPTITERSGSYHCTVYSHTDESGRRVYESFTDPDMASLIKRVTEFKREKAARDKSPARREAKLKQTVRQAMTAYVDSRVPVLSPTTITAYYKIIKGQLQSIMDKDVRKLTQEDIQNAVSQDAQRLSPKSLRNSTGLLSASLAAVRPDFSYHISLPQKEKRRVVVPSPPDIRALLDAARDTDIEVPVTLAALCGMRLSEISALRWSDIDLDEGIIHITRSLVHVNQNYLDKSTGSHNDSGAWVEKRNKTTTSTRDLRLPDIVLDTLRRWRDRPNLGGEYICLQPYMIDRRYRALAASVLPNPCTFHQLRHYCASVMNAENFPMSYVSAYLGHSTDYTTRAVYTHNLESKRTELDNRLNAAYNASYTTPASPESADANKKCKHK